MQAITIETLLQLGLAGVALFFMWDLNKRQIKVNEGFKESMEKNTEAITKLKNVIEKFVD